MTTAAASSAMGIVGVLAMLPRHLQLVLDPVHAALNRIPANLDAEVRGLCARFEALVELGDAPAMAAPVG